METKIKLFNEILTSEFSTDNYKTFVAEFFNEPEWILSDQRKDYWNWSEFSVFIEGYIHYANYKGSDNNKVSVYAVEMKKGQNIDRARSAQRNFVIKLIENSNSQAAIVAFYSADDYKKWRLSFVKLDAEFANGKLKNKITPAKRYSYLVGEKEPCHTAQKRLLTILNNDKTNPTLEEIEEAFSVEKVTKEFFEQYKNKYIQLKEHLENNADFMEEAERHRFTAEQFSKKLMGQIVFLYFVQKKGWLGVNALPKVINEKKYADSFYTMPSSRRYIMEKVYKKTAPDVYRLHSSEVASLAVDEEELLAKIMKGEPWGTGPRNFMRELYVASSKKGANYFDDYLEPLFYEALNKSRGDISYYSRLHCKIPFLNGGLFEALDNYDWDNNKFDIPNDMFSNAETKDEWDADGILDIFDRYNFTMNEDEPLEKEVAVDPEMLGKIFENLLDVKDRKSKGAFYTPREIVHYMCQESIINYLVNKTGLLYEDLKDFIVYGEFMRDTDTMREAKDGIVDMLISNTIFDMKNGVNRLVEIDNALSTIKVCDPAVGSGAFPLGMINEIVKARVNITSYFALLEQNPTNKKIMFQGSRHPYRLKIDTIKNCIYAVDIEPSAVDITKLRLWLALSVDDETDPKADEYSLFLPTKDPKPLPNLDCNIRCGNSLIDEIKGVKLIQESELFGDDTYNVGWHQNLYENILKELFDAQDRLFAEKNHDEKENLKTRIANIKEHIIMQNIKGTIAEEEYFSTKNSPSQPYFVWQLEFAKVFKDNGGFDVVIGNPPYVDSENMVKNMPELRVVISKLFKTAKGNWDLYIPFLEKGFDMLSENGNISFITPNKWLAIKYGEKIRQHIFEHIFNISDFSSFKAFESADISTITVFASKKMRTEIITNVFNSNYAIVFTNITSTHMIRQFDNLSLTLSKSFSTLSKLLNLKTLDSEFNTNEAATVSETYEIAKYLVDNSEAADTFFKFVNTGTIDKYCSLWGAQEMTYVKQKYLHPTISKIDLKENFIRRYEQALSPKIITTGIRYFECFYDKHGCYLAAKSTVIITEKSKLTLSAILPILNSNLAFYYLKEAYGGLAMGGGVNFTANNLSRLPLPELTQDDIAKLENITEELQDRADLFDSAKEFEIDQFVYKLYGLEEKDINTLETFKLNNKRKR